MPRRGAGDCGGACSAAGHPGEEHVNQGPQDQAHCHGHTESYDQRDCEETDTEEDIFQPVLQFVFLWDLNQTSCKLL